MGDDSNRTSLDPIDPIIAQQQKAAMLADEDPLLISQSLTYVTDDGSTLHSFHSSPLSTSKCQVPSIAVIPFVLLTSYLVVAVWTVWIVSYAVL